MIEIFGVKLIFFSDIYCYQINKMYAAIKVGHLDILILSYITEKYLWQDCLSVQQKKKKSEDDPY